MGSSSSRSAAARVRSSSGAATSAGVGAQLGGDRRRFVLSSLLCGTSFGDASGAHQIEDEPDDAANLLDVGNGSPHSSGILPSSQISNLQGNDHLIGNMSCNFSKEDGSSSGIPKTRSICSTSGMEDHSLSASVSTSYPTDSISELSFSNIDETSMQNQADEVTTATGHEPYSAASSPNMTTEQDSDINGHVEESSSLDSDLLSRLHTVESRNSAILHFDVLSISSEILTSRNEEIRENDTRSSRSLFWDAFLRRSSRRNGDVATVLLATEDGLGSRNRWLLDYDTSESSIGDEFRFLSRRQGSNDQRQSSNSELRDIFRDDSDERSSALCVSGLHPDGTCSCDSLLIAEGLRAHASISRIVVLAEALFEVLDEIHHHSIPFPLSMVSQPAPESVVNSFPLKTHQKLSVTEEDDQCYICLAEYEDGDKVRVLPCKHEYHMSCVDKWLKEIHGICPLCRRDVSEGVDISPVIMS